MISRRKTGIFITLSTESIRVFQFAIWNLIMIITTSYKFVEKYDDRYTQRDSSFAESSIRNICHNFIIWEGDKDLSISWSISLRMFGRLVYYPHIIHQSKISNCFLDPFLYRAGNDSHNRNGKRYIVIHISYKMNLISVVIYCYDWIRYLCNWNFYGILGKWKILSFL